MIKKRLLNKNNGLPTISRNFTINAGYKIRIDKKLFNFLINIEHILQ